MDSARLFPGRAAFLAGILLTGAAAHAQAPPTSVGSTSPVQTTTLTFFENATIGSINVLTQGAPNLDFEYVSGGTCTAGMPYTAGQTCTVNYTFSPTNPNTRNGAVVLYDTASPANAAATHYLHGTGMGPQIIFTLTKSLALGSGAYSSGTGFLNPDGIAVDGKGDVFVADTKDGTIREIMVGGAYQTVKTIATGLGQPQGLAMDGAGNLFYADALSSTVNKLFAAGGYSRMRSLGSGFSNPHGVAVDLSGNVFVADTGNNAVKEIVSAGGYTTVKTLGTGFGGPLGVAVDTNENVFVADTGNNAVKEILAAGGYTTVNTLNTYLVPTAVAVDAGGNLFVGGPGQINYRNPHIWEYSAADNYTETSFWGPAYGDISGVVVGGAGNIFYTVDNTQSNFVYRLDLSEWTSRSSSTNKETISNDGNQPLHIADISYPPDFSQYQGTGDCAPSTDLAPNDSCAFVSSLTPKGSDLTGTTTTFNEVITITDNNLNVANAVQEIGVSGSYTYYPAALTGPVPSSTLSTASATFKWTTGSASNFQFRLGTKLGSNDIYGSGPTSATSETVSNLPSTGIIHARLYYMILGAWKYADYVYYTPTALIAPAPGSTLAGSAVTFNWNAGASTTFQLQLGTSTGAHNIYDSGQTTNTSETVNNLPTNGETIHARLYYLVSGAWQYTDCTYTAQ